MRVLALSEFYPHEKNPHEGIAVRERLACLSKQCEIRVVAPAMRHAPLPRYKILRAHEARAGEFSEDGQWVTRFPVWNLPVIAEWIAPGMHRRGAQAALAKQNFVPDLIHAFWAYRSGFVAAQLKQQYECPLVITVEGSDIHTWLHERRKRSKILYALHSADAIIAVSRALADCVIAQGIAADKIHHIPNGVDLDAFAHRATFLSSELRNRFSTVSLFLCVANLLPVKGQDLLIRALALLPEETAAVVFIGEGPERPRLQKLVEELQLTPRIFFAGRKPHNEIAEWMSAVDALVIPSRNEGWPTVIFEALACGLQVIGASVGGIPEALGADGCGILVPPENPAALAAAMSAISHRKPDKNKLRARAERFSWERLSEQVLQVYQSVLGEGRR